MPPYDKVKRLSPGDRAIPATTWNAFVSMYEDKYQTTSITGDPLSRPVPPILSGSSIALAVLKKGQDSISGYSPVRITKVEVARDLAFALPLYEVEAVDAVDENGDPTDRHGNYAFTMAEGVNKTGGGRIVIAGLAIVALTRDQCVDGTEVGSNYLGSPFDGYDGKYEGSYYVVPDGTILDDDKTLLAPIGHFKVTSWYDPSNISAGKTLSDRIFFVIDMNQRFTSISVELFAAISGYSGGYDDQTYNQGYAYVERPLEGVPAEIADVNPRISNNSGEPNTPSIKNGESNYFRCLVTNPHLYDISEGTHVVTYSASYNRLIVTGDPVHNDGRINTWYYYIDSNEKVSRGHASAFEITGGWGNINNDNTDTCPYPTSYDMDDTRIVEGRLTLATDYMTAGGGQGTGYNNQGVTAITADAIAPAIVLMLDSSHDYATWCSAYADESVLVSAPFGEFKIIDKKPLHNNTVSGSYPQWSRCLGFLQNQTPMSTVYSLDSSTFDDLPDTANDHYAEIGYNTQHFPEVLANGVISGSKKGLTREGHVDNAPNPHYHGVVNLTNGFNVSNSGTTVIDGTTLYSYSLSTELFAVGVEADLTETTISSSRWAIPSGTLLSGSSADFFGTYNLNFFWEEKYKWVYFFLRLSSSVNDINSDTSGSLTLHRKPNYAGNTGSMSGKLTQASDFTLPAWPTYPNGDIESAGVKLGVR